MLLARPGLHGAAGCRLPLERVDRYEQGEWLALLAAAQEAGSFAEVSSARHLLMSAVLVPVVSLDGRRAYDTVLRIAFLCKVHQIGERPCAVRASILRAAFCLPLVGRIRDLAGHTPRGRVRTR